MAQQTLEVKTRDGVAPVHLFTPAAGGAHPAVILFMDGRGIRPALFEMGERLAAGGYTVLLPDLFYRAGPYEAPGPRVFSEDPEARKRWFETYFSTATQANVISDTRAFLDFLAERPEVSGSHVGTTGYCMGGGLSLAAAAFFPERVVAAASYHGGNLAIDAADSPHRLAGRIKARVYVAGAVEDPTFDDAQKERLRAALAEAGVDHQVETYAGARHGWVPPDSAVHHPDAAERHWRSLFALLDAKLKA